MDGADAVAKKSARGQALPSRGAGKKRARWGGILPNHFEGKKQAIKLLKRKNHGAQVEKKKRTSARAFSSSYH